MAGDIRIRSRAGERPITSTTTMFDTNMVLYWDSENLTLQLLPKSVIMLKCACLAALQETVHMLTLPNDESESFCF